MQSFLEDVIQEVHQQHKTLDQIIFVLPSKRAGTFLKNTIAATYKNTLFAPQIYSIESFVEHISGLGYASNTQQLFELYTSYLATTEGEKDSFYSFSKWGQVLLQDFNEIDRYLVDPSQIFSYLTAIQELDHWSKQLEKTQIMEDHLLFWNSLEAMYHHFNAQLHAKELGHQGMVYREACKQLQAYIAATKNKKHVFVGFNALNTAEATIIQKILEETDADIYWDIDPYFINNPIHDAGLFIRQHQKNWPYLREQALKGPKATYLTHKNIQIIGVPKNVSQAKYVGDLLTKIQTESSNSLAHSAVVLGDETLLNPILNSVPEHISPINITMGYPLYKTPVASFFNQFFDLHLRKTPQGWFHQNVLEFLSHPYLQLLLTTPTTNAAVAIASKIKEHNWVYINDEKLNAFEADYTISIKSLFFIPSEKPKVYIEACLEIIHTLKAQFQETTQALELEYLYRFFTLFNQLKELIASHPFVNDLRALQGLYRELLSSETLDFQGEPLKGLQIMGMLESRNLDFETVILTSVNEGILPSGKSNNSFIPFDVKKSFGLPTYKEKDAVYTYHFYRLLQRAKNVYLLYNTEPDVLEGGEKSRLISQLLTEEHESLQIEEFIAAPQIHPIIKTPVLIKKDADLMSRIQHLAAKGFSPTSLSNYIRNPIDFYKKSILKIKDRVEVEESIAANTFGTIVHNTLEDLYKPFVGSFLDPLLLKALIPKIKTVVKQHFKETYSDIEIKSGKNLIAFEVVVRYVENFIRTEIVQSKKHQIKIIALEQDLEIPLSVPNLEFPVVLKGKLDRIDEIDGVTRIIDYKTGTVRPPQVKITDWDTLITDYDKSKAFQLLCYALMYHETSPIDGVKAGIISFKNLGNGLFEFTGEDKQKVITPHTLASFTEQLNSLLLEICTAQTPFLEKEV